ncbi:MAG TPA: AI-2E family transporter, partial [Gemmatimonadales bacterium]|nr:AI-2E family transporter [Gemmatimonadales bacterium]
MSEPGGRRLAATLVVLFAVGLLLVFLGNVAEVLFLLFIAALLATYLSALTGRIVRLTRLSRGPALAMTVVLTLLAVAGIGWLVVPPVVRQTQELVASLPGLAARLETVLLQLARQYPLLERTALGPEGGGLVEGMVDDVTQFLRAQVVPYLTAGGRVAVELVSVLAMALYLARDPDLYRAGLVSLVPPPVRHIARTVLADLGDTIRAWIWAQLLAMAVLAVLTAIGLSLLRVPYALAFGVFTGAVAIVPFFGTIVSSALPAVFVLGSGGWIHALAVALLGVAIHLVEANVVAPLIFQERIRLPPVLTI